MNNVDKLNSIQSEVARAFENIDNLIRLESELIDVRRLLQRAKDTGDRDTEKKVHLLIMKIEKSINEIVSITHFVKFRKKPKYTVM